jgi:hypothetical protein
MLLLVALALAAAHEGEEFVIILPAIMLGGAFFLMRWANQGDKSDEAEEGAPAGEPTEDADQSEPAEPVGSTRE